MATERLHLLHGNPAVADTFEVMDVRTRRPLLLCTPFVFLCTVSHSTSLVTMRALRAHPCLHKIVHLGSFSTCLCQITILSQQSQL